MSTYQNEIAFINRKLLGKTVKWNVLAAMSQIVSDAMPEAEAKEIVSQLKDALWKKAAAVFMKMVFTMPSKLQGGVKVVISVPLLREYFAGEIETDSSGGGKGLNPFQSQPRPPGGRR